MGVAKHWAWSMHWMSGHMHFYFMFGHISQLSVDLLWKQLNLKHPKTMQTPDEWVQGHCHYFNKAKQLVLKRCQPNTGS